MIDEKKKKAKEREKAFDKVFYIVLGLTVIVAAFYWFNFNDSSLSKNPEDWGVFGDFMGGTLNPLLAFFSFILLLLNLKIQREQLDNAEKQLELNHVELAETRNVMNEQLKAQALQQFESLFFALITQLQNKIENLEQRNIISNVHKHLFKNKLECMPMEINAYKNLVGFIYFIIQSVTENFDLHQLDDRQDSNLGNQRKYVNILVAMITDEVIHFLIRDVADVVNTPEYERKKEIIQRFHLLKNISFNSHDYQMKFWLIRTGCSLFREEAFDKNKEFLRLKKCNYINIFYSRYPVTLEECLYKFLQGGETVDNESLNVKVDDGSEIKIYKRGKSIKICYGQFELKNFYIEDFKLSLIFANSGLENHKYSFDIYFGYKEDELVVENILRVPLF